MKNILHGKIFKQKNVLQYVIMACALLFLALQPAYSSNLSIATIEKQLVEKKVTLNVKNASLKDVLYEIQKQSGINFIYKDAQGLDKVNNITVNLANVTVAQALTKVLGSTSFDYKIAEGGVTILKRAQPSKIELMGKVVDSKGNPMLGATIIAATGEGTITDDKGAFVLTIAKPTTVEISCVGYLPLTQEIATSKENLIIKLENDEMAVDDVVVTGIYTRATSSFTGAATVHKSEDLIKANPTNLLSALSILDPSFKLVENLEMGSDPNSLPEFEVRGSSSLPGVTSDYQGSANMPTFIMDGFEVSAETVFDLDPERVETITILKDAAATAIYGSRSANGVVVITTKVPKSGNINISYSGSFGFTTPDLTGYQVLDAQQKLDLEVAAGFYSTTSGVQTQENLDDELTAKQALIAQGNNTYWLNKPLETAFTQKHTLTLEGGDARGLRFAVGMTVNDSPGVMKESSRSGLSGNVTLQYNVNNKLIFRNYTYYSSVTSDNSPYGSFSSYVYANPYYNIWDTDGKMILEFEDSWSTLTAQTNPLWNSQYEVVDQTKYNQFVNNFSIEWRMNEGLRFKGTLAVTDKDTEGTEFKPANHTDFINYSLYDDGYYRKGSYTASNGKYFSYDASATLSYVKFMGDHNINAVLSANIVESTSSSYGFTVVGFPDEDLSDIAFALDYGYDSTYDDESDYKATSSDEVSRMIGIVANVNYAYKEKYLFDFSYRTDASSKFGDDCQWAPFWSLGLAWNAEKEDYIKELGWIDRLKLRASIGSTGSQSYDPYQAMTTYSYILDERYRFGIGSSMKTLGNENLQWQSNLKINFGLDLYMFDNKINLTADYYNETSHGLLTDVLLPYYLGFYSYRDNLGKVQNSGVELSLRYTVFRNSDGYLTFLAGGTRNKNILKELSSSLVSWNDTQNSTYTNEPRVLYVEGESINTIWGCQSLGINPANGKEVYLTPDGEQTQTWSADNQVPIGVNEPELEGNLGAMGSYKGFNYSVYFKYRLGGDYYNQTLVSRVENADKSFNTDIRVLEETWQEPGDVTFFQDVASVYNTSATSRFVSKYSWLQLSSVNVSYDLPKAIAAKIKAKSLRVGLTMNDIFTLSNVKQERGTSYPFARTVNGTLRVLF